MQTSVFSPILPAKAGLPLKWGNVYGCSTSLAIAHAALQSEGPLVVLTSDTHMANRLERELSAFLLKDVAIWHFPDWETLPYDNFSPPQDIISERLEILSRLPELKKGVVIVAIPALLHRIAPCHYLTSYSFTLKMGEVFDWDRIRVRLVEGGYQSVTQVMRHGEFATRGSIIDIFPMGLDRPVRIDLFDNQIDSLRLFDPETQRSADKIDELICLPAREFPLNEDSIKLFKQQWQKHFSSTSTHASLYKDVSNGYPSSGIEYYLPLFFKTTQTLIDYFPPNTTIIRFAGIESVSLRVWEEVEHRHHQYAHDLSRPILPPKTLFIHTDELLGALKKFKQVSIHPLAFDKTSSSQLNFNTQPLDDLTLDSKSEQPLNKLTTLIKYTTSKILICCESPGRREIVLELLNRFKLYPHQYKEWHQFLDDKHALGITVLSIDEGCQISSPNIIFVAESQLYGEQVMQRRRRQNKAQETDIQIKDLNELKLDAPVVHIQYGIGRYRGLTHLSVNDQMGEYLILEYADKDKLYIPVSSLHLISQYAAHEVNHAPLHKLGTDQWDKAKKKAAEKACDVAAELLDVYARRAAKVGFSFQAPSEHYFQFASSFAFEETPDQAKAIHDVLNDMQQSKPMDRLVCGDVGFGKTEVALRAAFLALQNNKQVMVLVPTTLLAQQHFETISDRLADWPFKVDVLSRFRSKVEIDKILTELSQGKIDIVVGTHKLLQPSIKFKDLGLVVIDEEHRFGVKQKEQFKTIRAEIDLLTLTATPIPRTLNMAMASLRDLSIIATPPAKRLSIKTFVQEHNIVTIQEAIMRELMRGGQVYYLHNEVHSIEKTREMLCEALPQARIEVAHGQMRERQLEKIMSDFYHQRFNVLVCTTIIETGIDIPSANTIIIDRADKLGLAQLHQLRGRVGRSHHQAYAYCLTPAYALLTPDAIKRLEALSSLEELGSGFTLATHDLEIRGAGELLGEEQSGSMQAVGLSLYMELLDRAVNSLKKGQKIDLDKPFHQGPEINLQLSALIPEEYLPDVHTRLILYKRIANSKNSQMLYDLQVEMIDRFGLLPEPLKNLFKVTELKLQAQSLGIQKIDCSTQGGKIEFIPSPPIDPMQVIQLIRDEPKHYKLVGSNHLKFLFEMPEPVDRFKILEMILKNFEKKAVTH